MDSAVQCLLSGSHDGPHFGLLDSLEYGLALWARWLRGAVDSLELYDCAESGPAPGPPGCCLFAGHVGRHTWEEPRW
ncbi:hypothetical protein [Streptomyces sp. cmx-4-9]|uniref:hypothetical protein n=1 Tax=Streptomyces sp. cmx-4-9 TaxID=2790941 RepID=UPI003980C97D